tara:strand:+ start:604 stop:1017 length:414 start_codon:yes stop_codon:yes gene_type:complete
MTQVGVFTVGKPKYRCVERRIFNSIKYILSENEFKNIVYDENQEGLDVIYVFTNEYVINLMIKMFLFNKVLMDHKIITKEILFQKNLPKIFSVDNNEKILREFLNVNLNSDLVLDKINDMGIDSLTEIDFVKIKKPT